MTLLERMGLAMKLAVLAMSTQQAPQADGLLAGLVRGTAGRAPERNTKGLLETYIDSPWIRACAAKVADAIGAVRWRLYTLRSATTGKLLPVRETRSLTMIADPFARWKALQEYQQDGVLEEVRAHLFLDLLKMPNSEMTGLEFRRLLSIHTDLVGDVFCLKTRNAAQAVVGLWPIPPHWVVETPLSSSPMYRLSYGPLQQRIPEREVLWMRSLNPTSPYGRGSGIAKALDDEISIDEFAGKHSLAYFRNNARPDLLVMPKEGGQLGEAERDRLDQWWREKMQGYWRRFKPLFLTRPMDVTVIDQKLQDMQLTDIRQAEADTILQVWSISPEIFGRLANSNKATVEKAIEIFSRYVLTPRLEHLRETWQERLLAEYDERLILTYDSPVPIDQAFTLQVFGRQPNAFALNEWRELAGQPPLDELDGQFGTGRSDNSAGPPLESLSVADLRRLHALLLKAGRAPEWIVNQ